MLKRLSFIAVCSFFVSPSLAQEEVGDPFVRDVLIIADWFEGEFDNEEQLWFHGRSRAEGEPPTRIHVSNRRVELPEFGEHVFYTEEYAENDQNNVIRQRLVIFSSDPHENAIRMRQGFFKNADTFVGGHLDTSKFEGVSAGDVFFLDECDVFLRRVADQFQGGMAEKSCVFGEDDERRYSVHDVTLSENKFWRTDATFLVSDNSFFRGTPPGKPTELRRAKSFICDFYFDAEEGGEQQVVKDLRVHSQGGVGTVVRESDGQSFDILIREKEYPYYSSRPDFMYYSIRHSGAQRSVAYGVTDPDSRQFGTKTGKVGAFCHREGFTFREQIGEL